MSKLIQKAGFLSPKRAGRYMNYIATRDGVELLDENADSIYMRYIATRPRAEKHGEHGLFGAEDAVDLEKTLGELKAHEGTSGRLFTRCAARMPRGLAMITPQAGGRFCAPNRQTLRKPCKFHRRSFGGMQRFMTRAITHIST